MHKEFWNNVLRKIFRPKRQEGGKLRILHKEFWNNMLRKIFKPKEEEVENSGYIRNFEMCLGKYLDLQEKK